MAQRRFPCVTGTMVSIFERALGDEFAQLHPRMRERLDLDTGRDRVCVATGIMNRIWHGSPALKPMLHLGARERLLLPESGHDIPFTMENRPFRDAVGREGLTYTRTFDFGSRLRRFDSATVFDPVTGKLIDHLGAHRLVAADWDVHVDHRGGLVIHGGPQRVGAGRLRIHVPRFACAQAEVRDYFDPEIERFRIDVRVTHAKLGTIIGYEGEFTCHFEPAR